MTEHPDPRTRHSLWPPGGALVGMVHLRPLPGSPRWAGSMNRVLDRALEDAAVLREAGFDALLVENFQDVPFYPADVPPETVAAMARVVSEVVAAGPLPVGVNVLRNDARAALAVALAGGADFIRVNVHTGVMWTDQGTVEGRAADTLRVRAALQAPVAILADVLVKHATPPPGLDAEEAARDAWHRGLADALVVSGSATGEPADPARVQAVREAVPEATVLVGSGVDHASVADCLRVSHGVIVGTALAREGRAGTGIDPDRARRFVEAARG